MKRVFIFYGQGGWIVSGGMYNLGLRLRGLGYSVSFHGAQEYAKVANAIDNTPDDIPCAGLGFSLGGNALAWMAQRVLRKTRKINLLVAYDPTKNGPPLSEFELDDHVLRAISYKQVGWFFTSFAFGRGVLVGPQVEVVETRNEHLLVQYDESLHRRTIAALDRM